MSTTTTTLPPWNDTPIQSWKDRKSTLPDLTDLRKQQTTVKETTVDTTVFLENAILDRPTVRLWGQGLSSSLHNTTTTAAPTTTTTAAPDPTTVVGCQLWLKADSLSLVDGDPVATWTDSSGGGHTASESDLTRRPTWHSGVVNGYPVVRFDGVDDGMVIGLSLVLPYTIFVVYAQAVVVGTPTTRVLNGDSSNNWLVGTAGGQHSLYNGNFILGGNVVANTFVVISVTQDGSGAELFTNGVSSGTDVQTGIPGAMALASEGNALGTVDLFAGDLAELLVYDSVLGSTDSAFIQNYLLTKYGL